GVDLPAAFALVSAIFAAAALDGDRDVAFAAIIAAPFVNAKIFRKVSYVVPGHGEVTSRALLTWDEKNGTCPLGNIAYETAFTNGARVRCAKNGGSGRTFLRSLSVLRPPFGERCLGGCPRMARHTNPKRQRRPRPRRGMVCWSVRAACRHPATA